MAKKDYPPIEELYEKFNERTIKLDGIAYKIKFYRYRAVYPYERMCVSVDLTPVNKKSKFYLERRRQMGDDWSIDGMNLGTDAFVKVYNQLLGMKVKQK